MKSASAGGAPVGPLHPNIGRAESARSVALGLAGMSVAVLTFPLFFLFPQDQAGKINRVLFHLTLDVIVGALFAFAASTLYFSRSVIGYHRQTPPARDNLGLAYVLLTIGLALFILAPALILFTTQPWDVGIVALALWILFEALTWTTRWEFISLQ